MLHLNKKEFENYRKLEGAVPECVELRTKDRVVTGEHVGRGNMGTLATPERRIADLHIEPDETLGKSISKAFAWRNVLRVLQELSDATLNDATKIYFNFIVTGKQIGRAHV